MSYDEDKENPVNYGFRPTGHLIFTGDQKSIDALVKEVGLVTHKGYVGTEQDFERMRELWD